MKLAARCVTSREHRKSLLDSVYELTEVFEFAATCAHAPARVKCMSRSRFQGLELRCLDWKVEPLIDRNDEVVPSRSSGVVARCFPHCRVV